MKIGIILAYENNPYAGVIRPFINWAKFLKNYGEVEFLLLEVSEKIVSTLKNKNFQFTVFKNIQQLSNFVHNRKFDFIFTDDYIKRLKILGKINSSKKVIYVQVLYGIHSIVSIHKPLNNKEKILFSLIKFIPFFLFRDRYSKLIKDNDNIIIANSKITATLLHTLYGIEPHGIVYPPIDTEIFKPRDVKKKDQVLLYLGSHAGDTDENFVSKICEILKDKGLRILTMGNIKMAERLSRNCEIEHIHSISDEELAKVYSECILTICPQEWEQFGYVVAESIACGTPVLAFNIMGPKEIIEQTRGGLLANNKQEFLELLRDVLNNHNYYNNFIQNIQEKFIFDIQHSTKELIKYLEMEVR